MIRTVILLFFIGITEICFAQSNETDLLVKVLKNLQIDQDNCYLDLLTFQSIPDSIDQTIVFIPEISERGEGYLGFNVNLIVVNSNSGEILSRFSEDKWLYNDAVGIDKVEIHYNEFKIGSNVNSIVLKITQSNRSRIFPYSGEYISIFSVRNDSLKLLLKEYMVKRFNGVSNMGCEGEYEEQKRYITSVTSENLNFYNLKVIDSMTTTIVDKDCNDEFVVLDTSDYLLIFKEGQYVESKNKQ